MFLKIRSKRQRFPLIKPRRSKKRSLALLLSITAVLLWFSYLQIKSILVKPEAIFVLGGHENRERFAAQFAQQHPELDIWVSSGSPEEYAEKIFAKAGIAGDRLHLDYQAIDTVTNFTTLVDELKNQGIDSAYLITSEDHMRRARIIGEIVFGSRGIVLTPIAVPSDHKAESIHKSIRDGARALLWLTTGSTGATLGSKK